MRSQKSRIGTLRIVWHPSDRYHKRKEQRLVKLVEEYGSQSVGVGLGLVGELPVLEGFALNKFILLGREVREFEGRLWIGTGHDLDFILARDGIRYGIEVKNTLRYIPRAELLAKIRMCNFWGIRPVFVCRMLPRDWIGEVQAAGGFSLILKWQLYPWTHADLAKKVKEQLGLSVDSPRRLAEGTMQRFLNWHNKLVNS